MHVGRFVSRGAKVGSRVWERGFSVTARLEPIAPKTLSQLVRKEYFDPQPKDEVR